MSVNFELYISKLVIGVYNYFTLYLHILLHNQYLPTTCVVTYQQYALVFSVDIGCRIHLYKCHVIGKCKLYNKPTG